MGQSKEIKGKWKEAKSFDMLGKLGGRHDTRPCVHI